MPKIKISPAQAILLLMDEHEKNPEVMTKLKNWYLSGIEPAQHNEFKTMCSTLSSPNHAYEVSFSNKVIDDDPTKRYFETHLAQRTVKYAIGDIDSEKLDGHIKALYRKIDENRFAPGMGPSVELVDNVLQGKFDEQSTAQTTEYANYIARIDKGALFGDLDAASRKKVKQIVQSAYLGLANLRFNKNLPLKIYGKGIYRTEQKGKVMKNEQESTRNQHMGLMKGYMPVSQDDIAYSEKEAPLLKPSDQATYQDEATWVKENFEKLVHPYSNSISGTMLCQLRNMAFFKASEDAHFTEKPEEFVDFLKVFMGTMLYGSGGHTLHEFSAPLQIKEVVSAFSDVTNGSPVTMKRLFLDGNTAGFEQALQETRRYNHQILKKSLIHDEIRQAPKSQMISKACMKAMRAIESDEPLKAQEILSELKSRFEESFGHSVSAGSLPKEAEMLQQLDEKIHKMVENQSDNKPSNSSFIS